MVSAHYISSCVLPFLLLLLFQVQLHDSSVRADFVVGVVCDSYLHYAYLDQQICDGANWWVYWINNNGGLTYGNVTQNVTLQVLDTTTPNANLVNANVQNAYEQLVNTHNATILISPSSTARATVAIKVAEKYKRIILVVSLSGDIPPNTAYSFFLNVPAVQIPIPVLRVLVSTGAKEFILVTRPDDFSMQMANISRDYLLAENMKMSKMFVMDALPSQWMNGESTSSTQGPLPSQPPSSPSQHPSHSPSHAPTPASSSPSQYPSGGSPTQGIQSDISSFFKTALKAEKTDALIYCANSQEFIPLMVVFNDANLEVKAAVFPATVSAFEQKSRNLGTVGDGWLTNTRFSDTLGYGQPNVLGGTTSQFMASYTDIMDHPPQFLDPLIAAALMSYVYAVGVARTIDTDTVVATMKSMGTVQTFATPIEYASDGSNLITVEIAVQNLNGVGEIVIPGNVTYPYPWPYTLLPSKGFDTSLAYKIIFPVTIVCIGITVAALLLARYHRRQAVEAMSKAEEGSRRNHKIDFKQISLGTQIGAGSFGNVFRGEYHGADVCVKKLKYQKFTKKQHHVFSKEAEVMVGLRHPNVVLFMGICTSSPNYCIVTEYMQRGSLFDVIHNDKLTLKPPIMLSMMSDILKGLQFIHAAGIIHRDLKSPNLLVDRNWAVKIADFGLASTKAQATGDARVSLLWTAPEVLLDQKGCYTEKSDIYSFGIVLWELMSRKVPFEGVAVAAISPAVVSNQRPPLQPNWCPGITSLITSCWHNRPGSRPTVKETRGAIDSLTIQYHEATAGGPQIEPNSTNAPPSGHVTFVCSTVQQLYQPWSDDPWTTAKAIALLNARVLEMLKADNGHEVRNDGVSFLFAFSTCSDAFTFCLRAQTEVMQVGWPESILKFEETQEVSNASGEILFRGISLRMGIHTTSAVADKDLATGAINYLGKGINLASKLAGLAKRGQILIGADSFSRLGGTSQNMPQYYMESLGSNALENELSTICLILPFKLKGRLWDQPELQFPPPPESLPSTPSHTLTPVPPQRVSKHFNTPSFYTQATTSLSITASPTVPHIPNTSRSPSGSTMRLVFTGTSTAKATGSDEAREAFEFPPAANKWMIEEKDLKGGVLLDKSSQPWEVSSSVLRGGDKVVVEKFSNQKTYDGMLLEMRAETAALRRLHHPNVAKYYGLCLTSQYLCLVTEFSVGSLSSLLQNPDNYGLPWEKKFSWAVDIAKGMWYLHSNGIIHTDLKSANVVFTPEGVLKIIDYGFNRIKTDTQAMTQAGTVGYVAPEVFQGNSYTVHTDVYSYGIILWELIFQVSPWAGEHSMHIVYKVTSSGRPSVKNMPPHTPHLISTLMDACWQQNPVLRPGFVDIIAELDPKVLSDM